MKKSESCDESEYSIITERVKEERDESSLFFVSELWKRSDFIRRWNLRYFELYRDGMLRFFQDKPSRRLRGVFLLNLKGSRVCREDSSDPRVITFYGVGQKWNEHATPPRNIVATSKSKLILRAVNLSTAARWIVSLNRFIYGYEHTQDEYTTNEKVLAKRMYRFPNIVKDDDTFAACDAVAFLIVIQKVPSLGIALGIMESMISNALIEAVDQRHKDGKFRNEFVKYKYLVKMKRNGSSETRTTTTKLTRKSSKDFFCTDTLARNMAHVAIAAALAASDHRNSEHVDEEDEEEEEEEVEEDEEKEEKKDERKTITRIDSSEDHDGITKAQRESIDRLLLHSSKSTYTLSSKPRITFNPFRSRDVSKVLRRKLNQYITDLQKLQKVTRNAYNAALQSNTLLQQKWKAQQSKLRIWARESYIPIFKSRAELRLEKSRIEQDTIRISIKALNERINMASNLNKTLEQLNETERKAFARNIDDSFFVCPEDLVREAQIVTREDLNKIQESLEILEQEIKRDVRDKLLIMSDERRRKNVRDAVKMQMLVIRSGRYIVSKSARRSFRSAVRDERTDLGRLLKRYGAKVKEACSRTSELPPPPTIIKTFATYFSDKVAEELNLSDLVGNMNDEIERNGGQRKEKAARSLDILAEDLIMGMLEVTDLCNRYSSTNEIRKCDEHWREQQNWLCHFSASSLGVPTEFLPSTSKQEYAKSLDRMNEWADETATDMNPTLMRMKLLRAIRVVHEESSSVSLKNTKKTHKLCGETLVPILVFVLINSTKCHHLHRSIFLMQQVALHEWGDSSECAYYLTAMTAALAFICHLEKSSDDEESYVVGSNPNESEFQKIFSESSQRGKEECLREMQDFIASQEAVEDLLESFGFA